ncbi:MAG: prolyl oligopeptidase family serine peptidase [Pseudomonadota bacterium]
MAKRPILATAFFLLAACSDSDAPAPEPNESPAADAGADAAVIEGSAVTLNAGDSSDADGSIVSFEWMQVSGPQAFIVNPDQAAAVIEPPLVDGAETLTFSVTVTDDDGARDTDTVDVAVSQAPDDEVVEVRSEFDGFERAFSVYTPADYERGDPAVVLLHGGGQSMRTILLPERTTSRWLDLADRDGFLLIVPNGFNETLLDGIGDEQSWNDIRDDDTGRTSLEDDVGFLLSVLDAADAGRDYDPNSVFVTGSSNGGIMSMTMLIETPTRFEGAAAFIAALPQETIPDPAAPTPIMLLNGTLDQLILFGGGPVAGDGAPTRSVPATVDYFIEATNPDPSLTTTRTLIDAAPGDGCLIVETEYLAAGGDPAVTYYEARGGGHNVPDPTAPAFTPPAEALLGPRCRDANGVDLANAFRRGL